MVTFLWYIDFYAGKERPFLGSSFASLDFLEVWFWPNKNFLGV